jgi:hypothetical protein
MRENYPEPIPKREVVMYCRIITGAAVFLLLGTATLAVGPPDTLWTRTYGGSDEETAYSLDITSDGGYILAGRTQSFGAGNDDVYLVRTNSTGDTLWTKVYGGTGEDLGLSVQAAGDGGFVVGGHTSSFGAGNRDMYILRTNALGDTFWTRTYGTPYTEYSDCARQTSSGGYILAGYTGISLSFWLYNTNDMGDSLWAVRIGSGRAYSVRELYDGGFISTGYRSTSVMLVRTDPYGDTLWTRYYGGPNTEEGRAVEPTSDGGFVIAGHTNSFGAGGDDVYLIKTHADGTVDWTRTFGGTNSDQGKNVKQLPDGGFVVVGNTSSFGDMTPNIYVVRTDENGDTLWTGVYGGSGSEWGYSIQLTEDGGFAIAGEMSTGYTDFYLVRLGPEYECGDGNGDGGVTTADGYGILNYFGSAGQPVSCWVANVNGDNNLTTADGFYLLNYFGSGSGLSCAPCEF